MSDLPLKTRSVFIAICGIPNAGKSTLLNSLIGTKVVPVSPKVQTTRNNVRGVLTVDDSQVVFVDTPGLFSPRKSLEKKIVGAAQSAITENDVICLVVDAVKGLDLTTQAMLQRFDSEKKTVIVIINKIDAAKESFILGLGNDIFHNHSVKDIFYVSGKTGCGINGLRDYLLGLAEEDVWHYSVSQLSDQTMQKMASEATREKLFLLLDQELPYCLDVTTEAILESKTGILEVHQLISTANKKHKSMIIGKNGNLLRRVSDMVYAEIEAIFGRKVKLSLFVKHVGDWIEKWDSNM